MTDVSKGGFEITDVDHWRDGPNGTYFQLSPAGTDGADVTLWYANARTTFGVCEHGDERHVQAFRSGASVPFFSGSITLVRGKEGVDRNWKSQGQAARKSSGASAGDWQFGDKILAREVPDAACCGSFKITGLKAEETVRAVGSLRLTLPPALTASPFV